MKWSSFCPYKACEVISLNSLSLFPVQNGQSTYFHSASLFVPLTSCLNSNHTDFSGTEKWSSNIVLIHLFTPLKFCYIWINTQSSDGLSNWIRICLTEINRREFCLPGCQLPSSCSSGYSSAEHYKTIHETFKIQLALALGFFNFQPLVIMLQCHERAWMSLLAFQTLEGS